MFEATDYRSALFERFVDSVQRLGTSTRILDLGPATPVGLNFWTSRGFSVSMHDLVTREDSGAPFDFGRADLGGVLCWNGLAALDRERAAELVAALRARLVPGGVLFAIFDGDGRTVPGAFSYRICDASRLRIEPTAGGVRPRAVSTAEIDSLLSGFKPTRVTVMRHGSREALGHVPDERVDAAE
ncbi:MAG: hypothetical protein GKS06_10540 [Acidobacteria bacterium]|nr:hypothetical protein [Acidobacteriota bacterium]